MADGSEKYGIQVELDPTRANAGTDAVISGLGKLDTAVDKTTGKAQGLQSTLDRTGAAMGRLRQSAEGRALESFTTATESATAAARGYGFALGTVIQELRAETSTLALSATARAEVVQLRQIEATLAAQNVRLNAAQTNILKAEISAQTALRRAHEQEVSVLERLHGPMLRYQQDLQTMDALLKRGAISQADFNRGASSFKPGGGGGLINNVKGALGPALPAIASVAPVAAAAIAVKEIVQLGDEYANLQNKLRQVTDSTSELRKVNEELFTQAQNARVSFEGQVTVFARAENALKQYGYTTNQVLAFTGQLSKALAASGASSEEARAGLLQLSQGLNAGRLQGDELRSVLENLPFVADAIAKRLGTTRDKIKDLGADGKITSRVVVDAFNDMSGAIDERFAKAVPTAGQALQVLKNDILKTVGEAGAALGPGLLKVVQAIGSVLKELSPVFQLVGKALNLIIELAGPVLAVVGKIASALGAVASAAGKVIDVVGDVVGGVGDAVGGVLDDIFGSNGSGSTAVGSFFDTIDIRTEAAKQGIIDLKGPFADFFDLLDKQSESAFASSMHDMMAWKEAGKDVAHLTAEEFQSFIDNLEFGESQATLDAVKARLAAPAAIQKIWDEMTKKVLDANKAASEAADKGFKKLREEATFGAGAAKELLEAEGLLATKLNQGEISLAEYTRLLNAKKLALEDQLHPLDAQIRKLDAETLVLRQSVGLRKEEVLLLQALDAIHAKGVATSAEDEAALGTAIKENEQAKQAIENHNKAAQAAKAHRDALKALFAEMFPIIQAQRDLAKVTAGLDELLHKHTITVEQHADALFRYKETHREALDPVGSLNAATRQQIADLTLSATELARVNTERSIYNDLVSKGVDVITAMATATKAAADIDRATSARTSNDTGLARLQTTLDQIKGPQAQFAQQLADLNALQRSGAITADEYATAMDKVYSVFGETSSDTTANAIEQFSTFNDILVDSFAAFEDHANDFSQSVTNAFSTAFDGLTEVFVNLLHKGEFSLSDLASSVDRAVSEMVAKFLQLKLLGLLFPGSSFGGASAALPFAGFFAEGGQFKVGGSGGTDSQLIALRATPGEEVTVRTPGQREAARRDQGQGGGFAGNIINNVVFDPRAMVGLINSPVAKRQIFGVFLENIEAIRHLMR